MRWILAGLAFALLIGLAVFTVAMRTRNLAARARIALHGQQINFLRVEQARRKEASEGEVSTSELIGRVHEFVGPSQEDYE